MPWLNTSECVLSNVFSALYAGITTTILLPLNIGSRAKKKCYPRLAYGPLFSAKILIPLNYISIDED
jgi:hypothetical protein|tara:strand:- start:69 stop:269 length:201 start_codon:yes stop_codon:yes gene_type:complete